MPSNLVGRGKRYSEKAWGQASALASKSYPKPGPDASKEEKARFYGTVNKITKNIQGAHGRTGRSSKDQKADMKTAFEQGFMDRLNAIVGSEKTALITEDAAAKAEEIGKSPDARSMARLIRDHVKGSKLENTLRMLLPALAAGGIGATGGALVPFIGGGTAAAVGGGLGGLWGLLSGNKGRKAKEKKRQGALDEALQYTKHRAGMQRGDLAGDIMGAAG